jgi:hypothetical protein
MFKALLLEWKAMAFTPTVAKRRKVWRTIYGGEPSPELVAVWPFGARQD